MSIRVDSLCHVYHPGTPLETRALAGVNLLVERGEWIAVVGQTGSGKSTLAQHLNALLLPTGGSVSVDGISTTGETAALREVRRKVGLVFQYPEHQLFAESVREEMAFGPKNWNFSEEEINRSTIETLTLLGLPLELLDRSPFQLSGGQKRRLCIASVLASRPDYLVLDEPTAGMDAPGRKELLALLKCLVKEGIGVVHITHDLELALALADRVLVLEKGKTIFCGTPDSLMDELLDRPLKGLCLPPILDLVSGLRDYGYSIPYTLDPDALAERLEREIRS
ncbi:MAG: ATP-binding cassette domain-containing protein [Synergistales bacterium]